MAPRRTAVATVAVVAAAVGLRPAAADPPHGTLSSSTPLSQSWATRAFYRTPRGQLHYVTGGDLSSRSRPVLLLLHSHPRSTAEFNYLLDIVHDRYSFVAIDYFGAGASDDCTDCRYTENLEQFVTVEQYAGYAVELMHHLGVHHFIPFGSEKGAFAAMEIAAAYPHSVRALVLATPLWLGKEDLENMAHYVKLGAQPDIDDNEVCPSHLLATWNAPGNLPLGHSHDAILKRTERTIDGLRTLFVGWQYMMSEIAYNDRVLERLRAVRAPTMLLWAERSLAEWAAPPISWDTALSVREIEASVATKTVHRVDWNGAMMVQNATLIAGLLDGFVHGRAGAA